MKIKICGIRRPEDTEILNRCKPDYAGFVFAGTKRRVSPERAEELRKLLDPDIRTVGVFVNENPENILLLADKDIIDVIQLHGDETEEEILFLKAWTEKPVIKAVRVRSREYVSEMEKLSCDMLLLDTYKAGEYGGTGDAFDLSLLPDMRKPFLLAGGLTPDNIKGRLAGIKTLPFGVDISSGAETDGVKDEQKILGFMRNVREFESSIYRKTED
ncbi:MAG: phosphoribosylanthranilate isomerase [Eubacteriales bacterium]|nr:phosphoribosylanthranilate isomerase [Eubacteriales bacterium]